MSRFGFNQMLSRFDSMKQTLPPVIGNMGVRYFLGSFETESFDGQKWPLPQRRVPGTMAYKYPKKKDLGRHDRGTLIGKSGGTASGSHQHLRPAVNNSLKTASWPYIEFAIATPYARRHNEGLGGMPKRQYIGYSTVLSVRIKNRIDEEMRRVMHR